MKFFWSKQGILSVCLVVATSVVYFSVRSTWEAGGGSDSQGASKLPTLQAHDAKTSNRSDDAAGGLRPAAPFEELKGRWLALRSIHPSVGMLDEEVAEREKLAIESLRILKLSSAVFELDKFLSRNQIPINRDGTGLLVFLGKVLADNPSIVGDYRNSFLEAIRDADGNVAVSGEWQTIIRSLAKYGDEGEYESYYQSLLEVHPGLAMEFLLSRSGFVVKKEPDKLAAVIESSLERLGRGAGLEQGAENALVQVVKQGRSAAQFEATLQVLGDFSQRNPNVDLSLVKEAVTTRWAYVDPVRVAELALGDSSLYSDDLMRTVGASASRVVEAEHGMEGVLDWLGSIPDKAARNHAILGAALSEAAGYLEGGKGPEYEEALQKGLQISNLLPAEERRTVFSDYPALFRDRDPMD
jgi:hypothetical protein